jgi:hypothetical protein
MKNAMVLLSTTLALFQAHASWAMHGPPQNRQSSNAPRHSVTSAENQSIVVEQQRLQLERQKFAADTDIETRKIGIEQAKLDVERATAKWSAMASIVPLMVALLTLAYSTWSFRQQGKQQVELKAAEFAFLGKTPEAVLNRCKALKQIFGRNLPDDFGESFDPGEHGGGKEDPESKRFFLELLLKYPLQRAELTQFWRELFGDPWLDRVKPLLNIRTSEAEDVPNPPKDHPDSEVSGQR